MIFAQFNRFSKVTVEVMNFVSRTLTPDDPGLVVEILDIDILHEAMGLASSPFAEIGDTPAESVEIFRNWILEQTDGVANPGQRVDIEGSLAWHHLRDDDVERLALAMRDLAWEQEIHELELEGFAIVWRMSSASTLTWLRSVFHR